MPARAIALGAEVISNGCVWAQVMARILDLQSVWPAPFNWFRIWLEILTPSVHCEDNGYSAGVEIYFFYRYFFVSAVLKL